MKIKCLFPTLGINKAFELCKMGSWASVDDCVCHKRNFEHHQPQIAKVVKRKWKWKRKKIVKFKKEEEEINVWLKKSAHSKKLCKNLFRKRKIIRQKRKENGKEKLMSAWN